MVLKYYISRIITGQARQTCPMGGDENRPALQQKDTQEEESEREVVYVYLLCGRQEFPRFVDEHTSSATTRTGRT